MTLPSAMPPAAIAAWFAPITKTCVLRARVWLALADRDVAATPPGEVVSQLVIAALRPSRTTTNLAAIPSKLEGAVRAGKPGDRRARRARTRTRRYGYHLDRGSCSAAGRIGMAHIGDSCAYMLRDGELAQITKDDTVQTPSTRVASLPKKQ